MIFSRLLTSGDRASPSRSRSTSSLELPGPRDPEYIFDESQLPCIPPQRPNLRELNNSLEALAVVFPDVQIEVFRELLANFDGESRLALVADTLLKNRVTWVKGRWRVVDSQGQQNSELVPRAEIFRSPEYKNAAQALAFVEFKGLSRSTILGVLAESNYSYLDARQTLVTLSSKSFRFALSALFLRRKPVATSEAENHPLVTWRSSGHGSIVPTVRSTGNPELDRELYDALVRPLKDRERDDRESKDRDLAILLNNEESENAGAVLECACCFITGPFEEFTHCNREGHMICFRCVQHSIREALFGQGWLSSINPHTGTLRCLAVEGDGCPGHIPSDHIHRAMLEERNGADLLHKLDQRLAEHSLITSELPLIRCPFCSYAEIDDIFTTAHDSKPRMKVDSFTNLLCIAICVVAVLCLCPFILVTTLLCLVLHSRQSFGRYLIAEWGEALKRHSRRRRGLKFSCQNPKCGRVSCLSCNKAWVDVHICHESSLVALRTQVEQAMSMAIKRVCPRCTTSFVKNSGCNKLTCPCGYKMCYVCRADLSEDGYRHFCGHFRPEGDARPCTECDRCNLWEREDTEEVLRAAREEAELKWQAMENRDLSGSEKAFLETGMAWRRDGVTAERVFFSGKWPTTPDVFDYIVETLFI